MSGTLNSSILQVANLNWYCKLFNQVIALNYFIGLLFHNA